MTIAKRARTSRTVEVGQFYRKHEAIETITFMDKGESWSDLKEEVELIVYKSTETTQASVLKLVVGMISTSGAVASLLVLVL